MRNFNEEILAYKLIIKKRLSFLLISFILCILFFIIDISTGPAQLDLIVVCKALLSKIFDIDIQKIHVNIVYNLRLPMALMAVVVGAALGLGGALMQTILNNPLASPYTLGLSAAAGFGASLMIAFNVSIISSFFSIPLGAFLASLLSSSVLFMFAKNNNYNTQSLVLVGIALLFLFQSFLSLVQYLSSPEVSQQILFWLFGSLSKATYLNILIVFAVTMFVYLFLLKDNWALSVFRLGEKNAKVLGVNLVYLRIKVLFCVCLVSSVAISFVGVIGFIGLVAPHIARIIIGEDQRFFLPASMIIGALFLSLASSVSKIIVPGALFPIGIVTSFIGVPFFFFIILRNKNA